MNPCGNSCVTAVQTVTVRYTEQETHHGSHTRTRTPQLPQAERAPGGARAHRPRPSDRRARSSSPTSARQRHVTDYKALVCVYMFGGNDSNNMIVPVDTRATPHTRALRGGLALTGSKLLAPIPDRSGNPYALHYGARRAESALHTAASRVRAQHGRAQSAADAGAVLAGASRAAEPVLALRSDNTGADRNVDAGRIGWGGRLLDLFGASDTLAAVSVSSPAIFLQGADVRSNVIPPGANSSSPA